MVNMMKLMKQAQDMQKNMQKLQEDLAQRVYEFSAGGGAVTVTVKGDMAVDSIKIDPKVLDPDDVEMLQDMIQTAVNGALQAARDNAAKEMGKITGGMSGMGIPGFG